VASRDDTEEVLNTVYSVLNMMQQLLKREAASLTREQAYGFMVENMKKADLTQEQLEKFVAVLIIERAYGERDASDD